MARPKVYGERINTALRIPQETHEELTLRAAALGWSTNRYILACLDLVIEQTERPTRSATDAGLLRAVTGSFAEPT